MRAESDREALGLCFQLLNHLKCPNIHQADGWVFARLSAVIEYRQNLERLYDILASHVADNVATAWQAARPIINESNRS